MSARTVELQPLEIITVESLRAAVLRRRARPVGKVTADVKRLIDLMLVTLRAANGLGLAAPQVGEGRRVLVADVDGRIIVLIDPVIDAREGEEIATEACLSIPGVIGPVRRSTSVTVRGKNRRGRGVTLHAEGLLARVLQHEIDHLDGILFLDRVEDPATIERVGAEQTAGAEEADGQRAESAAAS